MPKMRINGLIIKDKDYNKVIDYFNKHNDNRTAIIAKHFKLTVHYVSYIIDVYLSKKANYNGPEIIIYDKLNGNCKKLITFDENNEIIGRFESRKQAAKTLGIAEYTIYNNMIGKTTTTIKGYKFRYE